MGPEEVAWSGGQGCPRVIAKFGSRIWSGDCAFCLSFTSAAALRAAPAAHAAAAGLRSGSAATRLHLAWSATAACIFCSGVSSTSCCGLLQRQDIPVAAPHRAKGSGIGRVGGGDAALHGVIEGLADRYENIRVRARDYSVKLRQLFDTYARLELLFPETDLLEILESPKKFMQTINAEAQDLERIVIINALDLLYFWMYQPRSRSVLKARIRTMSEEERQIFVRSQCILQREREISQLFLFGLDFVAKLRGGLKGLILD